MTTVAHTRIKICGIRTPQFAMTAAGAGADAIGLVFVERSSRYVTFDQAAAIVEVLPAFVEPVGLFVNAPIDQVRDVVTKLGLRTIQLHGREDPDYVRDLAPLRVIKVFAFDPEGIDVATGLWREDRPNNLAAVLLDAPPRDAAAAKAGLTGGSGQALSLDAVAEAQRRGAFNGLPPLILAGGLTPEHIEDAVRTLRPWGVDVSSGVESSRGVKDARLISAFCGAVRRADVGVD